MRCFAKLRRRHAIIRRLTTGTDLSNPSHHQRVPAPFAQEIHPYPAVICPAYLFDETRLARARVYFAKYGVKRYQKITKRLTAEDL